MKHCVSSLWDRNLSAFCISIIVLLLSFVNASIIFLLPVSIGIDLLILLYATYATYRQTFQEMRDDIRLLSSLSELEDDFKDQCMAEIKKFRLHNEGNKFGTKEILVYISHNLNESSKAHSFFSDSSIVLLHKNFDSEEYNDRFTLLHEMGHCLWHSLIMQKRIATLLQSHFFALAVIIFSIMSHTWWMIPIDCILWLTMVSIENKMALHSRLEMGADATALITYEHLYGKEPMMEMARIVAYRYYKQIKDTLQLCGFGLQNGLWGISRFMAESEKCRLIDVINEELILEEECKSQENKALIQKIKTAKKMVESAPAMDSFKDYVMTWNPALYYFAFPLLMLITWFTATKTMSFVTIPWWAIFLCIIPIVLIVLIWSLTAKEAIEKQKFLQIVTDNQNL